MGSGESTSSASASVPSSRIVSIAVASCALVRIVW